jgi:hypothetical protein
MAVAATLGLIQHIFAAPLAILACFAALAVVYTGARAARGGRDPLDFVDKAVRAPRRSGMLVVRPGWARAAITLDILYAAFVVLSVTAQFLYPIHTLAVPSPNRLVAGVIGSIGTMGLWVFAHYMATRPVSPKRVAVPVGAN